MRMEYILWFRRGRKGAFMKHEISLAQYRSIDLSILAGLMVIAQVVIHFAASVWFSDQLYVVSPVAIIVALVMMRWSLWAGIHALLGGLVYAFLSGGTVQQLLIYGGGNLLSVLALLLFRWLGKKKIRDNVILTLLFGLAVQGLMLLGRAGVAALLGCDATSCLMFITTDSLSILFTLCGVWVVRRIDGLFEDQIQYLLRVQSEQSVEGGEQL